MSLQVCEWKETAKNMNNKLHTICSYMAMFPPSLPNHFIKKYSKPGDIVLDPFCGRGTAPLEACSENRIAIGNDKNPLAFVLTKAKVETPQKGRILSRIDTLEKQFVLSSTEIGSLPWQIKMIFSNFTLKQLAFLQKTLDWRRSNVDAFITAMLLGIMHGDSMGYLSVSMPNTFSMSPNYVKNYIRVHNLKKPKRNAFELLRAKLVRCYQKPLAKGRVFNQDARKLTKLRDSSVDFVITSPPYSRVIRYGQFNWIRLWFLGKTGKQIDKKLFFTQSINRYCNFMSDVLLEIKRVLKPGSKAVLVIGDVKDRSNENISNLAEIIWKNSAEPLGFKLVEPILEDVISDNTKVSRIWGERKGNATKIDRILIIEKVL